MKLKDLSLILVDEEAEFLRRERCRTESMSLEAMFHESELSELDHLEWYVFIILLFV